MVLTIEKVIAFIIALSSQIGPTDENIEAKHMALVTSDQETEITTGKLGFYILWALESRINCRTTLYLKTILPSKLYFSLPVYLFICFIHS